MRSAKWISLCVASFVWFVAPSCADETWVGREAAGIFQIRSEYALDNKESQELVEQISQLQTDVQNLLNLEPQTGSVEVNLFVTRTSYRAYLAKRIPEGMDRQALFVQGSDGGQVYVYKRWGFDTDLRHECTHAVLHNALPFVPMWIDEGLAEYFEVIASKRRAGHSHLSSLKRAILFGWRPDIAKLEAAEDLSVVRQHRTGCVQAENDVTARQLGMVNPALNGQSSRHGNATDHYRKRSRSTSHSPPRPRAFLLERG